VQFLRALTTTCTVVTVLLYLVLPLAVFGASRLSARITRPLIQQSYDAFNQVSRTFTRGAVENGLGEDGKGASAIETAMGVAARYERLKKQLRELEAYLSEQGKSLAATTFQLIAGYLFDCVVFPLAFAAVLILFLRGMPSCLAQGQRDSRLVETIRETDRPVFTPPESNA
ncbi:MAG: hypothetical protein KQI81_19135, partial [Deltaproteobacteria bacterium]|nr:hypothetical protein [Deltaproteobacteria bacterium]